MLLQDAGSRGPAAVQHLFGPWPPKLGRLLFQELANKRTYQQKTDYPEPQMWLTNEQVYEGVLKS